MTNARAVVRLLRPHQWTKNLLVLVAVLTAHRYADVGAWQQALLMFVAFCAAASAIYVVNDAVDVAADRKHADKSMRPFASGALSPVIAWWLAPLLLAGAAGLSAMLPADARTVLAAYVALSLGYCFFFKRMLWLDVLVLSTLYVLRVAGGAFAIGVVLSPWLLGFALFLFVSLATLKRYAELMLPGQNVLDGRAYQVVDAPVVLAIGAGSAVTAILVMALYAQSEDVRELYANPQYLWFAAPVLLYWIARLWTLAGRGELRADPILHALRDGVSYACGGALIAVFAAAL